MVRSILFFVGTILFIAACQSSKNDVDYDKALAYGLGMDHAAALPMGLAVNDVAPNIVGSFIGGEEFDLYKQLEEKPTVVIFYRGQWCPVCNRYLTRFQDSLQYIYKAGGAYVAIAPETEENASETIRKSRLSIPVISDHDGKIMRDYDVDFKVTQEYQDKIVDKLEADIAETNNQEEAYLPVPAVYIIDKNKKIAYRYFKIKYQRRAGVGTIVEALKALKN